jgi:hypothetical protein
MPALDFSALTALAAASSAVTRDCACNSRPLLGWESFPASLDLSMFENIGTLFEDPFAEPTFAEYHPHKTRYDSADAPVAPRYFPYNRCELARCRLCARIYLRYAEAGGYFVDQRMRLLRAELLADAPL